MCMIKTIVIKHLIPSQDYIFGFADLHGLIDQKFGAFQYGISIGRRLDDAIVDGLKGSPTLAYFNYYKKINTELTEVSLKIQKELKNAGIESIPIVPTISFGTKGYEHYLENLSYDISHKMTATRAGLGWIGKTDLFISERFGPRLRLVTILLDQDPGITATPIEESRCGKCTLCVEKCPAKAANGTLWNVHVHRDEFFNAHKCREMCGQLAKEKLGVEERICGMCVYVCPIGK
jgi:epoxyqueuosine reductase